MQAFKSAIAGHVAIACLIFFLQNCQAVFWSGDILLSLQQCIKDLVSLHSCKHLFFVTIFYFSYSDKCVVKLYLTVTGSNLHFLRAYSVEHLFMCSSAVCVSSLVKCFFISLPMF